MKNEDCAVNAEKKQAHCRQSTGIARRIGRRAARACVPLTRRCWATTDRRLGEIVYSRRDICCWTSAPPRPWPNVLIHSSCTSFRSNGQLRPARPGRAHRTHRGRQRYQAMSALRPETVPLIDKITSGIAVPTTIIPNSTSDCTRTPRGSGEVAEQPPLCSMVSAPAQ